MSVCWPSSAIDNHIYIHNCREITVSRELYLHVERSQSTQKEPEKTELKLKHVATFQTKLLVTFVRYVQIT